VAEIMANELGYDKDWEKIQVNDITRLVSAHLLN
jgi:hypothetical protein